MKKLVFVVCLFLSFSISNNLYSQIIRGNGKVRTDIRELTGYNEIIAQGQFTLILTQGDKEGVRIETDENLIELFQTRVDNKKLYVTMLADLRRSEGINVYVSIKALESIILLDAVKLKTETVIHFDELTINTAGMSELNLELFAASLNLELVDGTYAYLKGYTENFHVHVHDETELNAFDLQSDFCNVQSTGLTEVMIDAQKELKLMVTGGSNVYYTGNPTITERIFASTGFIVKRQRKNPR